MKNLMKMVVASVSLMILAGCSKPQENTATVQNPPTLPEAVKALPPPPDKSLAYYGQHLEEAKDTWHKCLQIKPEDITEEIRSRCEMAQTAWSTQPYKAGRN